MASTYMTPGVYIEEKNAFPGSAVAVETAVPVFIGYTEIAERKGNSLVGEPTRVTSFAEFVQWYGKGYKHKFGLAGTAIPAFKAELLTNPGAGAAAADKTKTEEKDDETKIDNKDDAAKGAENKTAAAAKPAPGDIFYLFSCISLFYQNGGSNCYIMSLGTYGDDTSGDSKNIVKATDVTDLVFEKLAKTYGPTMVVLPDFVSQPKACYSLYTKVLKHCHDTQSRFGIFDVIPGAGDQDSQAGLDSIFEEFRSGVGSEFLNYGAAYYPWLNTSIVPASDVNYTNLSVSPQQLKTILPEDDAKKVLENWINPKGTKNGDATKDDDKTEEPKNEADKTGEPKNEGDKTEDKTADTTPRVATEKEVTTLHQSLMASSLVYAQIMAEVRNRLNLLPPSAAMAGIYSLVDSTRGVWKSPANISLSMVNSPAVNISEDMQKTMNIHAITGKSINAIRPFPGLGSLVWGARTLDGNSQDWRYINVRRTMIMIEQSLKLACRAYVFEPNDSATWVTMKSMMNNFLNNLWKQGALAGAVPEQAFDVQVGLGATMTPTDILDGYLLVTVKLALVRPAEFIVLTFQQQQQQS